LPESHQPAAGQSWRWNDLLRPLTVLPYQLLRHRMAPIFLVAFLATSAMAIFETTFALMVPLRYGYSAAGVGALFAYAGMIQALTQGYLLGKIVKVAGELRLIRAGLLLFAIGMTPMAGFGSRALLFILLALLSLGYGFANPSIASLISKLAGRNLQGELLGVNQSALALARIIGPIMAGIVYDNGGPGTAYVGGGAVALLGLLLTGAVRGIEGDTSR
jgi:MFS family permease